jgi:ketosteroid isomerase-like protein
VHWATLVFRVAPGGQAGPGGAAADAAPAGAEPGDSAAVARVVTAFDRALEAGDSAAVLSLLSPDAVILESGGVETRDEYRSHHLAGDIGFARAARRTQGPVRVVLRGDAAWASSTGAAQGTYGQREVNSTGAELMVLTREPGGWKIRAIHWSSRARADASGAGQIIRNPTPVPRRSTPAKRRAP